MVSDEEPISVALKNSAKEKKEWIRGTKSVLVLSENVDENSKELLNFGLLSESTSTNMHAVVNLHSY